MNEIQNKILDLLRQETDFVTTKVLVKKLGMKRINNRKIGRWLTKEAPNLGLSVQSKYGHNWYKLTSPTESVSIEQPTPIETPVNNSKELLVTFTKVLREEGVDVDGIWEKMKEKKRKELQSIEHAIDLFQSIPA